ncbi:MAG: folylpolyglutamate synthase/dihydrofolate synthase family protein [Pirellulales bacterium]
MRRLLDRLENPQHNLRIVHLAGTKGKGSTAAMIASVLSAGGYRTGLYSSPHFQRVEERMAVNGAICSSDELARLVNRIRPVVEAMDIEAGATNYRSPTYFEITTALALLHFAEQEVDMAVLEVGLGGRLDSTNVCEPLVSVITNISFDHTNLLGNTLESIACEKAGIIKAGIPVVSGVMQPEAASVVQQVAATHGCRLVSLGHDFDFTYQPPLQFDAQRGQAAIDFTSRASGAQQSHQRLLLGLLGRHQAANAALSLATVGELNRQGISVDTAAIRRGLASAWLPARVEVLASRPTVILDTSHNVASVEALVQTIRESFSPARRILLFAATRDKDVRGMLAAVRGHFDEVVLTQYHSNPRGVPVDKLTKLATEVLGRRCTGVVDSIAAWEQTRSLVTPDDLLCVAGSFFLAAELRERIIAEAAERSRTLPSSVSDILAAIPRV